MVREVRVLGRKGRPASQSGRRPVLVLPLALALLVLNVSSGFASSDWGLKQVSGSGGCVAQTGYVSGCADGSGLLSASAVAVSPEGLSLYVASATSDAVAVFSRDLSTNTVTQLAGAAGCISQSGGGCGSGFALDGAAGAVVSPDGKNVYVSSYTSGAISTFSRDLATGQLTQLSGTAGCVSDSGSGGLCVDGKALLGASSASITPDGKYVYVASYLSNGVAAFSRDQATGVLTQLAGTAGCITETGTSGQCLDGKALTGARGVGVMPSGTQLVAVSYTSDSLASISINALTGAPSQAANTTACISETGTSGQCVDGKVLNGASGLAISPDGAQIYVASYLSDAVSTIALNSGNGVLTQPACISNTGTSGQCVDGTALDGSRSVAVSPDGTSVFAASQISSAVNVFKRTVSSGSISQLSGSAGCISETSTNGACVDGLGLSGATSVVSSPDSGSAYVANYSSSALVALRSAEAPVAPTCSDASATTPYETDTTVYLNCSDGNSDSLLRFVVTSPQHGTLGWIDQMTGEVAYTPESGFSGTDSFTYQATDGSLYSPTVTVNVTVGPAVVPVCSDLSASTKYGRSVTVPLSCADASGADMVLSVEENAGDGILDPVADDNSITYTPSIGFYGTDQFTYVATTNEAVSTPATVTITVSHPSRNTDGDDGGDDGTGTPQVDDTDSILNRSRTWRNAMTRPRAGLASPRMRVRSGKGSVVVFCIGKDGTCRGTLQLLPTSRKSQGSLGSVEFVVMAGKSKRLTIDLTERGKAAATSRNSVSVRALFSDGVRQASGSVSAPVEAELTIVGNAQKPIRRSGSRLADRITGRATIDLINAQGSSDTVAGVGGDDRLSGGFGNDKLSGGTGGDALLGDSGDDALAGGSGDDRLVGGTGDDRQQGNTGNDNLDGGDGDDSLVGGEGNDYLVESRFGDDILIDGGPGDDAIFSGRGNDREVNGGVGEDIIRGGPGSDNIDGGPGSDLIDAGAGADESIGGGDGDDLIVGGRGNDNLDGGMGDDVLYGSTGSDTFDCGDGFDIIYTDLNIEVETAVDCEMVEKVDPTVEGEQDPLDGTLNAGVVAGGQKALDNLSGDDNQPRADRPVGSDEDDSLTGGDEHDTLLGHGGDDQLFGLGANDDLDGGEGDDTIDGGPGNDRIFGRFDNDRLDGGDGDDELEGGRGKDYLVGGSGNDQLNGGFDDDRLNAGPGNDKVIAVSGGRDVIDCGPGVDTVQKDSGDVARNCERVSGG